jgi:hypothetical protein
MRILLGKEGYPPLLFLVMQYVASVELQDELHAETLKWRYNKV